MELHWNILDKKRQTLVPAFAPWKEAGFYLAGGTGLALQLGHRTSMDFDFYSPNTFDPMALAGQLELPKNKIKITTQTTGTLLAIARDIQISAFHYPYRLLRPLINTPHLAVCSLEDIAGMKIIAVTQRGTKRDFIDLYFLCRKFSLPVVLQHTEKKYPMFDRYNGLRALLFFDEAEKEEPRLNVRLKESVPWAAVKAYFLKAVQAQLNEER